MEEWIVKSLSRWIAGFAACSVLALTLTACGGDEPNTKPPDEKETETEVKTDPAEAEKEKAPAEKGAEKEKGAAAESAPKEVAFKCGACNKEGKGLASAPPKC